VSSQEDGARTALVIKRHFPIHETHIILFHGKWLSSFSICGLLTTDCMYTEPGEQPITYEQSKTMSDFFLKAMEVQYQPAEDTQEMSSLADTPEYAWPL